MERLDNFKQHPSGLLVSPQGEVFVPRSGKNPEHFTFGNKRKDGYIRICYKGIFYYVHRLVAECYLQNEDNLPCVNHKDENPSNNKVDNLEWCTNSYNNTYNNKHNKIGAKQTKIVNQYSIDGTLVKTWSSASEAGYNGYNRGEICKCCNNKVKTHKGYIWKYAYQN